jgi:type I restriction-modification system DNA methylase subunit
MPKPRKRKDTNDSGLNFEAQLWAAADKMRRHMNASEYKHVRLICSKMRPIIRDVRYSAKAKYQLSKAFWHLWWYTQQNVDLQRAVSEAQAAANLVFEPQYIGWFERVRVET